MGHNRFHLLPDDFGDQRKMMIAETSAFLSWALRQQGSDLPRIPRRRVSEGGFTKLLRQPGARAWLGQWWNNTLRRLDRLR